MQNGLKGNHMATSTYGNQCASGKNIAPATQQAQLLQTNTAPRHARKILILAIHGALLCMGMAILTAAHAAEPMISSNSTSRSYNIAAGSLADTLNSFARQVGVTLSFTPQQVQGLASTGLTGRYTTETGLAALLANHALEAVAGSNGYTLKASSSKLFEQAE